MLTRLRASRAFTLIELLVVLVVIAVLAAIILPKFSNQGLRGKESSLKADLAELRSAISAFQSDTGEDPLRLSDLAATTAPANGADPTTGTSTAIVSTTWHGPYIEGTIPRDPVSGSDFTYSTTAGAVGQVNSSASGNDTTGVTYSTY